jgi:hypothetical protein
MRNKRLFWCSVAVIAVATLYFAGIASYPAKAQKRPRPENNTPQTLPFTQNWSSASLITVDDDWSGVAGIIGYQGTDLFTTIGGDLSTVVADGAGTAVDVFANHADPDTFISGGVTEFDGIANPVVALQGSATADVPHIVIHLNTTGNTNINFACNLRDIDNSADNSAQQINVQYRVGATGDYTNVPGGYFPDVSLGPTTTAVTAVNLPIPAAANNQPLVTIRVATVNATGSDEWIGIDDINITGTTAVVNTQHIVDFNGDGKTDWVTVRNTGGGPTGQISWFVQENTGAGAGATYQFPWGQNGDFFVPADYDGDGKTDFAVWRAGPPGGAAWYVLNSIGSTVRAENYGQTGDDPTVVGDYNNDDKADLAVYRSGAAGGDPSFWFYRIAANGPVFARQWGQNGDFPAPGDYDGDGSADFVVQRSVGFAGQGAFWMNYAAVAPGTLSRYVQFGTATDVIVPGDYDGDGKTDLALTRGSGGSILWFIEPSTALGTFDTYNWGLSATDFRTQGDYDGDGKTDIAVYRQNADPTQNFFFVRKSTNGALFANEWGQNGDYPVANYNQH